MDITKFLGYGIENAVSRTDLSRMLNMPDRQVRRLIAAARVRGELIISSPYGDGYYLSDDLGEITRQLKMNERRARSVLVQNTHLRRKIAELESRDQVTIEEVAGSAQTCRQH